MISNLPAKITNLLIIRQFQPVFIAPEIPEEPVTGGYVLTYMCCALPCVAVNRKHDRVFSVLKLKPKRFINISLRPFQISISHYVIRFYILNKCFQKPSHATAEPYSWQGCIASPFI